MSSQSRLNASSDKYWLQKIEQNTAVSSDSNIQKLATTPTQTTLQAVGVFGANTSNKWEALSIDANGKLETTATISASGSGLATEAKQDTGNTSLATIAGDTSSLDTKLVACNTGAVVVSSTTLATGASTSALQTTGNTSLASIDNKVILPGALTGSGNLKVAIQELGNEGSERLNTQMETTQLPSALTGAGNLKVSLEQLDTSGTGIATSTLQTTGNTSLASIDNKVILPSALSGSGNLKVAIEEGGVAGGATSAKQDTMIADLGVIKADTTSMDGKITACDTGAVVVSSSALPTGASTSALQTTGNSSLTSIDGKIILPSALTGSGNLKVAIEEGGSSTLPTGASTSALQTTGNSSLASIDTKIILPSALTGSGNLKVAIEEGGSSTLPTGASTSAKQDDVIAKLTTLSGQLPTSLESGRLKVDLPTNSGNGGDDIYSNATISSANTLGATAISILEERKLMIIGNTSTSSARIGLAFSDTEGGATDYHPGSEYADLYFDGSKYCFAMTITDILTDNAKIYFQTPASNVNMWYFTY